MMPFDREAAKAAGWKDAEIDSYLAKQSASVRPRGQYDWREEALGKLPGLGAGVGGALGFAAGLPEGGIGAIPGTLIGTGAGAATGRNLEQMGRRWIGLPQAQANVFGQPLPQALDLTETALGYTSAEAVGLATAHIPSAARALALHRWARPAARVVASMLPGGTARAVSRLSAALEAAQEMAAAAVQAPVRGVKAAAKASVRGGRAAAQTRQASVRAAANASKASTAPIVQASARKASQTVAQKVVPRSVRAASRKVLPGPVRGGTAVMPGGTTNQIQAELAMERAGFTPEARAYGRKLLKLGVPLANVLKQSVEGLWP
jgi:hypothetical protein